MNSLILAFPPNFSLSTQACGSPGGFQKHSKSTIYNLMHIKILEVNFL